VKNLQNLASFTAFTDIVEERSIVGYPMSIPFHLCMDHNIDSITVPRNHYIGMLSSHECKAAIPE